ncbi:hypothetical protein M0M57_16185 [Flavobacterium azooxidireducens]|uniref:Uncharacterized protein n=1 Tax=Flavobacterium azooxidireducens TaxID=1871076 RepID=A0ABY4KEB6_9FLAO|nr:hypothetical protein [Flavobacterium azooxidireducens]UPQ79146.1 hypothetical protein M0M57_16185 [Flavobacterium azooxidireducens]
MNVAQPPLTKIADFRQPEAFHEETLSWQRELSSLSSATSVSGQTLAVIIQKIPPPSTKYLYFLANKILSPAF